jgi:hypothetical protein
VNISVSSLPGLAILVICIFGAFGFAWLVAFLLNRFVKASSRPDSSYIAGKYMTAFGSLFAFLTGFLINAEYTTLKSAQSYVGQEVAAATQLASASATLPPPDADRIQDQMVVYLSSLPGAEWSSLSNKRPEDSPSGQYLSDLQQQVYTLSERKYPSSAALSSMAGGIEEMTQARRQRLVIASSSLPLPLLLLCLVAGAALIVNALVTVIKAGARYSLVATGLVLLVALDTAAILAITGPFQGPFIAKSAPIEKLVDEIQEGRYKPWINGR